MRILWVNIALGLVCIAFTRVGAGEYENIINGDSINQEFKVYYNKAISKHFELSLDYLFTGIGYGNQRVQRPGMEKYLRELSNKHWKEGIDMLKKYFSRGGSTIDLYNYNFFNFEGKNELNMSLEATTDMSVPYMNTLINLHNDSMNLTKLMNKAHVLSVKAENYHDADWGHYIEEKVEDEEKMTRELQGLITNLHKMHTSSLALHIFDSNI